MSDVYELAVERIEMLREDGYEPNKVVFKASEWEYVKQHAEHHEDAPTFGGKPNYTVDGVPAYHGMVGDGYVRVVLDVDFDEVPRSDREVKNDE